MIRFLGSFRFAVMLIALAAIMTIAATVIESTSTSHKLAEDWVYRSPLFQLLLAGFFVNILLSACSRWPFQKRHIPFLITHLGLLMIITGVFFKHQFGVQGHILLIEGTATKELTHPDQMAIAIESRSPRAKKIVPITADHKIHSKNSGIELQAMHPHSQERYAAWLDRNALLISGFPPIPLTQGLKLPLLGNDQPAVQIYTDTALSFEEALSNAFAAHYTLIVKNREGKEIFKDKLARYGQYKMLAEPELALALEHTQIQLTGPEALLNTNVAPYSFGANSLSFDLSGDPFLFVHQDASLNTNIVFGDSWGRLQQTVYPSDQPTVWIAYDNGYKGYTLPLEIEIPKETADRKSIENALASQLAAGLNSSLQSKKPLALPLELLTQHAKDSAVNIITMLKDWHDQGGWLYQNPDAQFYPLLNAIDWQSLGKENVNALLWVADLTKQVPSGQSLHAFLKDLNWPLIDELHEKEELQLYKEFAELIFAARAQLPNNETKIDAASSAEMLSVLLRLHDISWAEIPLPDTTYTKEIITLESPLRKVVTPIAPDRKQEDLQPCAYVKIHNEDVALSYDPKGTRLKWPLSSGNQVARLQPATSELPFEVRLHRARNMKYPGSEQTLSYECDLTLCNLSDQKETCCTLSMNQVHETKDGYRLYLAGMGDIDPFHVQNVQIVVNRDPAKYLLTYPGGALVALGIILLFWKRK